MMKNILHILVVVFLSLSAGAVNTPLTELTIGIASVNAEEISLSTTKDSLHNENILVCIKTPSKNELCSSFSGKNFKGVATDDNVTDVGAGKEIYTFKYAVNDSRYASNTYGIAVIYPSEQQIDYRVTLNKSSSNFSVALNDGVMKVYICNGQEGVHVYSPQNKNNMHLYSNLGYDISPTCSNEVYQ